jgi:hypothetical protein
MRCQVKYVAKICLALLLAIPMTSPSFVGGLALTLVAVGGVHAEPVKPGTSKKKGCSIGVTGASGAQGELLYDDGDTVTVRNGDGTTQKFKCSDGTWVKALTANPANPSPSFDFDFQVSFTATEEEVSQACDDSKGVPTSGRTGYGCYKPKTSVLVICASNGACTGFNPLPIHAKTLRGFLGADREQVEPDVGGAGFGNGGGSGGIIY